LCELSTSLSGNSFNANFLNVFLFDTLLSKETNKDGRKSRFDKVAKNRVMETNIPNATVPPKLESVNTENPSNNTIEVYSILIPVSLIAAYTDFLIFQSLETSSCLYRAK